MKLEVSLIGFQLEVSKEDITGISISDPDPSDDLTFDICDSNVYDNNNM